MRTQVSHGSPIALLILPLAGVFDTTGDANGQSFPERPIRFIVPYPPGGSTDLLARVAAPRMSDTWGQPVVIDNRPGAAGNIGNDIAAKAPPDGYTIVVTSMSTAISMSYYRKLPYDVLRDLQGVALFANQPNALIAGPNITARSMAELMTLARDKPGQLGYASAGNGSSQHLMGELLKSSVKIDLIHVPYKGTGIAMNDLIGGQIALMFSPVFSAIPHIKTGRARAGSDQSEAPAGPTGHTHDDRVGRAELRRGFVVRRAHGSQSAARDRGKTESGNQSHLRAARGQ